MDVPFGVRVRPPGKQTYGLLPGCEPAGHSGLLVVVSLDDYSLVCLLPWWKEHAQFLRRESMYDRLLFPVSQSPSFCGLGHAQAGKPVLDPPQFTKDRKHTTPPPPPPLLPRMLLPTPLSALRYPCL